MKIKNRLQGALCVAMLATAMPLLAQTSSLSFISEPGDAIGQGESRTFTDVQTARGNTQTQITVEVFDGDDWFVLVLSAEAGEVLRRGSYEDAERAIWTEPGTEPGLYFYGNNRTCESVEGRFEIEEIKFGAFGYVERLRANFEQRCDGATATLWGDIVVDNPPKPAEMKMRLGVVTIAPLDASGEASVHYRLRCEYPTGGSIFATVEQSQSDGAVVQGSFETKTGCTAGYLPISSDEGTPFQPGPATITMVARMEDPNYSEFETDAQVVRTVRRKIMLKPAL